MSTNFLQNVPCRCGETLICFCGRCKNCGKIRIPVKPKSRVLKFEKQDKWLWEELDRIVATKEKLGLPTTVETEAARLIKRGLCGNLEIGGLK